MSYSRNEYIEFYNKVFNNFQVRRHREEYGVLSQLTIFYEPIKKELMDIALISALPCHRRSDIIFWVPADNDGNIFMIARLSVFDVNSKKNRRKTLESLSVV